MQLHKGDTPVEQNTSVPTSSSSSSSPSSSSSSLLSLRSRVQLCAVMLALECFVSFEEIFMVSVLRREGVPPSLVSLPGVTSTACGLVIVPLLGWASDRLRCPCGWGQKRTYALTALLGFVCSVTLLVAVQAMALKDSFHHHRVVVVVVIASNVTDNATDVAATTEDYYHHVAGVQVMAVSNDSFRHRHVITVTSNVTSGNVTDVTTTEAHGRHSSDGVSDDVTVLGALAILGFSLADNCYASCMSVFKVYMLAVTPSPQHDSLLLMGMLFGAVGGCLTSLLGSLDLAALLLPSDVLVDTGVFQCLAQAAVLLVLLLVLGPICLLTGSERDEGSERDKGSERDEGSERDQGSERDEGDRATPPSASTSRSVEYENMAHEDITIVEEHTSDTTGEYQDLNDDRATGRKDKLGSIAKVQHPDLEYQGKTERNRLGDVTGEHHDIDHQGTKARDYLGDITEELNNGVSRRRVKENKHPGNSNDCLDQESTPLINATGRSASPKKKIKTRAFLFVMSFLGFCTNYAFFIYVSNYVGAVVYQGDPLADANSDAYFSYVRGVHMTSLGMTVFYSLLVAFNLLHSKVLEKVGMRAEYVISGLVCLVVMVTLILTSNLVVFFITQVALVVYRSAVYTVPFILVNKYSQQDAFADDRSPTGAKSAGGGLDMALMTCTQIVGYLLVSTVMGPLLSVTGYPGTPIVFACASCVLGVIATAFVKFE